MKNSPLSYIEISKKNLIHNIKQFRSLVKRGTQISAVIKANAYGHGDKEVAKILSQHVDYFQVNSIDELERVRQVTKKPILLLGYVNKDNLPKAMKLGCILSAFDLRHLLLINQSAQNLGIKQKVHISIDAKLGREGLMPPQVEKFLTETRKMKNIVIDGVYAHFANIEDANNLSHANKQIKDYENVLSMFRKAGYKNIKTHISATSGVLAYEKGKGIHNIVRIGVGLYGMWPSVEIERKWKNKISLMPVMRWVTHITQIKTLPKGHSIGYGLSYITKRPTTIAIIPQGYSDGLDRKLSNNGEVLIHGKRAPILGRVAMNMFVVDISKIPNVETEDEVILLGTQKGASMTVEEIAHKVSTINYEIITRINPLLPRIIK